jgi:hypothetical protein
MSVGMLGLLCGRRLCHVLVYCGCG